MKSYKSKRTSEILKKTSKSEHKVYLVDFKLREYSVVGETHPQTIKNNEEIIQQRTFQKTATGEFSSFPQQRMQPNEYYLNNPRMMKKDSFFDNFSMVERFFKDNFFPLMIIMLLAFCFSQAVFARDPQGEFSALVENQKSRKDFKDNKEMMKYIKKKEKSYTKPKAKRK